MVLWILDLPTLREPAFVPQAVAIALGLTEEPGRSVTLTIADHLKTKSPMLVLDNAEHLLQACAQLADTLLRQCPRVTLLVTSRQRLGVAGELTYRVPSLAAPDPARDKTPEAVQPYESVQLFVERAQFQRPGFAVTTENAAALASICHRLDGIPLALELAAARLNALSVEEIAAVSMGGSVCSQGGSRTALARQQTLSALIDWSYELLASTERTLLVRLSVFVGGWTLAAAEGVCTSQDLHEAAVLELLSSLVDKSLVVAEERAGATRYQLLDRPSIRRGSSARSRRRRAAARTSPRLLPEACRGCRDAVGGQRAEGLAGPLRNRARQLAGRTGVVSRQRGGGLARAAAGGSTDPVLVHARAFRRRPDVAR